MTGKDIKKGDKDYKDTVVVQGWKLQGQSHEHLKYLSCRFSIAKFHIYVSVASKTASTLGPSTVQFLLNKKKRLGICSSVFRANHSFFAQKWGNERFAQKYKSCHSFAHFCWATWAICSWSLISSERCERISHGCSFLVSDLSDLLTSLRGNERLWANRSHRSPKKRKWAKMNDSLIFQ